MPAGLVGEQMSLGRVDGHRIERRLAKHRPLLRVAFRMPPGSRLTGAVQRDGLADLVPPCEPDELEIREQPRQRLGQWNTVEAFDRGQFFRQALQLVPVQLEAEDAVGRGSRFDHTVDVVRIAVLLRRGELPLLAALGFSNLVEPLARPASEARGLQAFGQQPTTRARTCADDVRATRLHEFDHKDFRFWVTIGCQIIRRCRIGWVESGPELRESWTIKNHRVQIWLWRAMKPTSRRAIFGTKGRRFGMAVLPQRFTAFDGKRRLPVANAQNGDYAGARFLPAVRSGARRCRTVASGGSPCGLRRCMRGFPMDEFLRKS